MAVDIEFFTVVSSGLHSIGVDYVDAGTDPDEEIIYSFVDFVPREKPGTTHWLSGLTPPRGIQLDTIRGRYSPEDGQLRTIIGHPTNEKQSVNATADPFTLSYMGQTTAPIALTATPSQLQAALEALSNINPGDVYVSGQTANEKQLVTVGGGATGGTFLLTLDGHTTTPISRNASASTLQAALQALSNIGNDGCSVTGPVGGPWTVEFTGVLVGVDVHMLTSAPRSETQVVSIVGTPIATGGQFELNFGGQVTADLSYIATAADVQAALEALSNIAPGDVTVTGNPGGPYTVAFGGAWANKDVPLLTSVPERNEVQTVTITGAPTGGTFTLNYEGQVTTAIPRAAPASTVRLALEALSNLAPGDVAVTGNDGGPYTITFQGTLFARQITALTATAALTPSGGVTIATTTQGLGIIDGDVTTATTVVPVFLTPLGTVTITSTKTGTMGNPFVVNFVGPLAGTDVAQLTATGATVTTVTQGSSVLGVELVANTPVLELGKDKDGNDIDLLYDVIFTVPDLDPLKEDRKVSPFAIAAPKVGGVTVDLADAAFHLPPKPV
jgi:hypothetical protein